MSEVYNGTVKFVSERGFLFLVPDGSGPDIFAHVSDFERASLRKPEQGERFEFEIQMTPKGPKAVNPVPVMLSIFGKTKKPARRHSSYVFQDAINAAIAAALKASAKPDHLAAALERASATLRRRGALAWVHPSAPSRMYDGATGKLLT